MPDPYRIESLERGLRVLAAFSPLRRRYTVSQMARTVRLPTSSVYRILRTLEALGYVRAEPDGAYTPGPAVLTLGYAALQATDVVEAAREPLKDLAQRTGETTNFGVLLDDRVLYLVRFKTDHLLIANIYPGTTLPARFTSMGKLLVALEDPIELPSADMTLVGPNALTDDESYRRELARIREQQWAAQDEELAPGLRSVAVPVRSHEGVVGAVNIAVDARRRSSAVLIDDLLPLLRRTAAEISLRLGYLESAR
ncbi:IclR family transcriptional regulator [Actinomadura sp. NPDC048955]|uniref:IclR family transcriptional regulator n=1 Tax=Actinomadura sp. NPDC048955 TaxID=3158228 RepID=UPI0033D56EF7